MHQNQVPVRVCYNCGQPGHIAVFCLQGNLNNNNQYRVPRVRARNVVVNPVATVPLVVASGSTGIVASGVGQAAPLAVVSGNTGGLPPLNPGVGGQGLPLAVTSGNTGPIDQTNVGVVNGRFVPLAHIEQEEMVGRYKLELEVVKLRTQLNDVRRENNVAFPPCNPLSRWTVIYWFYLVLYFFYLYDMPFNFKLLPDVHYPRYRRLRIRSAFWYLVNLVITIVLGSTDDYCWLAYVVPIVAVLYIKRPWYLARVGPVDIVYEIQHIAAENEYDDELIAQ
jgi:hypothetical protein